jgi:hypothetical protein
MMKNLQSIYSNAATNYQFILNITTQETENRQLPPQKEKSSKEEDHSAAVPKRPPPSLPKTREESNKDNS